MGRHAQESNIKTINGQSLIGTGDITIQAGTTPSDATSTAKGIVQLAGDLGGTAAAPTVTKTYSKSDVGLANVDNTSDVNKPVSTAQQTALNTKQATLVSGTNLKTVGGQSLLGTGDVPITGTSTAVTHASKIYERGTAISGLEFSNTLPGTAGIDYILPTEADFAYFASKGLTLIRLAFKWERLQPTLNGAFNLAYKGYIDNAIALAKKYKLKLIPEPHNGGTYNVSGTNYPIGSAQVPISAFANFWSRFAAIYKDEPTIFMYDLMNEPGSMPVPTTPGSYRPDITGQYQLIFNPSFEYDTYGWTLDNDYTRDSTTGIQGSYAVKQVSTGGYANFTTVNDSTGIVCQPNTQYTLSFYYTATSASAYPTVNVSTGSAFGTTIATGNIGAAATATRFTLTFTTGSSTTNIWIRIYNNGQAITATYDGFNITKGATAGTYMDYAATGTVATVTSMTQAAITAIRATGDNHYIAAEIDAAAGMQSFSSQYTPNPIIWWSDPLNKTMPSFHYYQDTDYSGSYATAWSSTLRTRIPTDVTPALAWAARNNLTPYVGEYGVPNGTSSDAVNWQTDLDSFLQILDSFGAYGTQWAGGVGYASASTLEPTSSYTVDREQMPIIQKHLGYQAAIKPVPATPDATTSSKGIIQLAGDLGGTAASPTVTKTYSKSDVGLGSVDNTSDANKPVSTAQQTALNGKANTTHTHAESDVTGLVSDLASRQISPVQQATQTTSFTAVANRTYPVNASSSNVTVTLPTSNAGDAIYVKKLDSSVPTGSTTGILILSGTINGTASTTVPLRKINQAKRLNADGSGGWTVVNGDLDLTSLYATTGEPGTVQLAGDLGGTAAAPTVPGLAAKAPLASPTFTGTVTVPTPSNSTDASTKGYVDSTIAASTKSSTVRTVTQNAHGFSVGFNVYYNGTAYALSDNTASTTAEVDGIIIATTTNTFTLALGGSYITGLSGLTAGTTYFLGTSGALTATAPTTTGYIRKALFRADSASSGYFDNYLGIAVAQAQTPGASVGNTAASDNGQSTAGTASTAARSDHTHADYNWLPVDYGYNAWAYEPSIATSGTNLPVSGTIYTCVIKVPKAITVTNINAFLTGAGATLTSGQNFAALYQNNTLLGQTVDQSTAWATSGVKVMAMASPVSVAAGYVTVAFWSNGTTRPGFLRSSGQDAMNMSLGTSALRYATANTGITTTAPSTLGTLSKSAQGAWWFGLS